MLNHRFQLFGIISATLVALTSTAVSGEMYKWVNEDGTTTYSNQPPADPDSVKEFTNIEAPRAEPSLPPPVRTYPSTTTSSIVIDPTGPKNPSEAPLTRASVRSNLPLAVQDPCLRSSDPLCHQKHKDKYRPYVGYAPHESRIAEAMPVVPPARGATNGASASGAVAGGTRLK